jgi:hypothetical protein
MCLFASLMVLSVGLTHIGNQMTLSCDATESVGCFGPWLYYQNDGSGLHDLNQRWRQIFSLNTTIAFDLWCVDPPDHTSLNAMILSFLSLRSPSFALISHRTPIFLALLSIHIHVPALTDSNTEWEKDKFVWCTGFYLFVALFGCFGYSGNLGVLAGFVNVAASFLCLVASVTVT